MQTHPNMDPDGRVLGFDVDVVYVSLGTIHRLLAGIEGVTDLFKRRPFSSFDEVHVRFRFHGIPCVVWEPFGDNSRYYIGCEGTDDETTDHTVDLAVIKQVFKSYQPPMHRKVIGDIITFQFVKQFFRKTERRTQSTGRE